MTLRTVVVAPRKACDAKDRSIPRSRHNLGEEIVRLVLYKLLIYSYLLVNKSTRLRKYSELENLLDARQLTGEFNSGHGERETFPLYLVNLVWYDI